MPQRCKKCANLFILLMIQHTNNTQHTNNAPYQQYSAYYILQIMMNQESTLFPKQLKLDDYEPAITSNLLCVMETSNLLLGSGARTSHTAIIFAKALHFMHEECTLSLVSKNILELGSGVGFLGIYLASLGANVIMGDVSSIQQMADRNIAINKHLVKGTIQTAVINWKNTQCIGKNCQNTQNMSLSTNNSNKIHEECLTHLLPQIDFTIICEGGGIAQLQYHLHYIAKQGMMIAFMQHDQIETKQYLNSRNLQEYLTERDIKYEEIINYHPDYIDERIKIYLIGGHFFQQQ